MEDLGTKINIKSAIASFSKGNLTENGLKLFQSLGYVTERKSHLQSPTFKEFKDSYIDSNKKFNETKALVRDWKYVDLLFQLSKEEVLKQTSIFDTKQVDKTIIETYLFFTVELTREQYSRTELSLITRELNRLFPMPVMVLFKHGNTLTLSVINRRLHKRDESKDVLEKVTQIKDISIQTPHRAHIEILLDLSFDELKEKHQFTNFVELHKAWQVTLDIKELNKKFFNELANWYFWAQTCVEFPNDKKIDADKNIQINLIRLITRLIFVWFLKEKKLVNEHLFDKDFIKKILKSFDSEGEKSKTYYTAILQNLFFATLNQKMTERDFIVEGKYEDNKSTYGIKNLYRYADQFKCSKAEVLKLFEDIPFLNGGLFDCLDKENEETGKVEYIDGFSRNVKKVPTIPDLLFFGKERTLDLSKGYGYKRNKEKCKGLLEIFADYKFTIEENTPIEEEIALDPELLGKVFENLLAYYNPETETTARKQTGSFYTPREIVDYMVDESLIAYLKTQMLEEKPAWLQLGNLQSELFGNEIRRGQLKLEQPLGKSRWKGKEEQLEDNLRQLITYNNENHFFSDEEDVQQLIYAIDHCKILDPACGSGAFPMGVLHKLVYVLGKVDPEDETGNTRWRMLQKKKAEYEISKALDEKDKALREEKLIEINKIFEDNASDYGRKLYLIENCIYGVDIQPIAVQISKLRFFISLIVDQKEKNAENRGIRPLPNLETKFVAANTLISLEKSAQLPMGYEIIYPLQEQLQEIRHRHFEAKTRKEKLKCQKDDKALRNKIADTLKSLGLGNKDSDKIASFDLYDQNISATFFDAEWMLGIKSGFDIVIGNPPYGIVFDLKLKEVYEKRYPTFKRNNDIYVAFFESSLSQLNRFGVLNFITPNTYLNGDYFKTLRKYFREKFLIREIVDFKNSKIFQDPTVFVSITILQKINPIKLPYDSSIKISNEDFTETTKRGFTIAEIDDLPFKPANPLIEKIISGKLKMNCFVLDEKYFVKDVGFNYWSIGKGKKRDGDSIGDRILYSGTIKSKKDKSFLKGKDIERYSYSEPKNYLRHDFEKYLIEGVDVFRYSADFLEVSPKIIYRQTSNKIIAAIDYERNLCDKTVHVIVPKTESESVLFLVALLNSQLFNYFYKDISQETEGRTFAQVKTVYIKQLPVIKVNNKIEIIIETIVRYIIICKKYQKGVDTFFERIIDAIVYELYLPDAIQNAKCEVLKHLNDLPEFKESDNVKNMSVIETIYKKLSDPKHPVSKALEKMDGIEEIRIVEGKK